jgi:hypothetical protein
VGWGRHRGHSTLSEHAEEFNTKVDEFFSNRVLKNDFGVNSIMRKLLIIKGHFSVIFTKHGYFNTLLKAAAYFTNRIFS